MKKQQIMIDRKLFLELVRYHCMGEHDDEMLNQYLAKELEDKLNRACNRIEYGRRLKAEKDALSD